MSSCCGPSVLLIDFLVVRHAELRTQRTRYTQDTQHTRSTHAAHAAPMHHTQYIHATHHSSAHHAHTISSTISHAPFAHTTQYPTLIPTSILYNHHTMIQCSYSMYNSFNEGIVMCTLLALVCALATVVRAGLEYPCTYTSAAGLFYDLSPLSSCRYNTRPLPLPLPPRSFPPPTLF